MQDIPHGHLTPNKHTDCRDTQVSTLSSCVHWVFFPMTDLERSRWRSLEPHFQVRGACFRDKRAESKTRKMLLWISTCPCQFSTFNILLHCGNRLMRRVSGCCPCCCCCYWYCLRPYHTACISHCLSLSFFSLCVLFFIGTSCTLVDAIANQHMLLVLLQG